MPDAPLSIDEIEGWPVFVLEGAPYGIVRVDCDRIVNSHVFDSPADVVDVSFECELRCVDTNHDQSLTLVFLSPGTDVRKRTSPVDARVCPEVDEHDSSAQALGGQWLRVEPP